jgi:hypothetical protein
MMRVAAEVNAAAWPSPVFHSPTRAQRTPFRFGAPKTPEPRLFCTTHPAKSVGGRGASIAPDLFFATLLSQRLAR